MMSTAETSINTSAESMAASRHSHSSLSSVFQSDSATENIEDYETQLLGFTPKSFVSGIYNAISEYFMEALQILEGYLQNQYADVMTASEIAEKMTLIRKHLVTHIDKAFDTLESYLSTNIFCVPASVVLPEDQVQLDSPVTQEAYNQVQQDIENMKKKILAVKLANATLKQRFQMTVQLQEAFDLIVVQLTTAHATATEQGVVDLHDSLSHCANQVLATLHILSSIKSEEIQWKWVHKNMKKLFNTAFVIGSGDVSEQFAVNDRENEAVVIECWVVNRMNLNGPVPAKKKRM